MDQLSSHAHLGIPMPTNTSYVRVLHGHDIIHNDAPHNSNNGTTNIDEQQQQQVQGYNGNFTEGEKKVMVRYKECQKNHAACMGGNATDGCGEFMPSTIEALICCACNCHRNFHRKEVEGSQYYYPPMGSSRKVILGRSHVNVIPLSTRSMPLNMAYHNNNVPYDDNVVHGHHQVAKKRFRTKFSQEQKEKMIEFAEKVGWKIQKEEECVVQQFCQEIGVKRRVLKVWMHNNKHTLANKSGINNNNNNNNYNSASSI